MASFLAEKMSIEGKGLRNKLTVISALMSVLPFLVFSYVLYREGLFFVFENYYAVSLVFLLMLSLAGLIILRQIFDKFIMIALYMKQAEAGEMLMMDVEKETAELHEITLAFNGLMKKLEETGERLESQTLKLKQAITERILTAGKLWEAENMYQELVEKINEAIFVVDKEGLLTYVSPVFENISGYTPAEAAGRYLREFVHKDDVASLADSLQRIASGTSEAADYRVLSKSGNIRWVHSFSIPIFTGEEIVGIQGLLRDITQQVETKKVLEQKINEVERLKRVVEESETKIEEFRKEASRISEQENQ